MYGRAPRALTIPISGTADDIGPGTYWPNEDAMRRKAGKNYFTPLLLSPQVGPKFVAGAIANSRIPPSIYEALSV